MKILYVLQQSITHDGKWLSADSNINMLAGFLQSLSTKEDFGKLEIDVLIAPIESFEDIKSYAEIFDAANVNWIPMDGPVNAQLQRQHFDSMFWHNLLKANSYDVIINCLTELSRNIKTILTIEKLNAKLITQCFWLDLPLLGEPKVDESCSYHWRQFDAFECSDLVAFACISTFNGFFDHASKVYAYNIYSKLLKKCRVWDFGYSQDEVDKFAIALLAPEKIVIGFLNRISDYTGWDVLQKALQIVNEDPDYADKFVIRFTNPSKRVSDEWLSNNFVGFESFLGGKQLTRAEYFAFLNDCDITAHLYTNERYGGCALRESIASKCFPIVANCHEQATLVKTREAKIDVVEGEFLHPEAVANSIKFAIDVCLGSEKLGEQKLNEVMQQVSEMREQNFNRCSFERTTVGVLEDIANLFNSFEAQ
jgi:glycosyltransferase involved in cell wall biosynthesis